MKTTVAVSYNIKVCLSYILIIPILMYFFKRNESENVCPHINVYTNVYRSIIYNRKKQKKLNVCKLIN